MEENKACAGAEALHCFDSAQSRRLCLFAGGEGESAHEGVGGRVLYVDRKQKKRNEGEVEL